MSDYSHWAAWLHVNSWAGCEPQAVVVVGETPKRYLITPAHGKFVKLAGRCRWLAPANTVLVPKRAVTQRIVS